MDDTFDLERLRRNWSPTVTTSTATRPATLEQVVAVRDPLREARAQLDELERLVLPRFPGSALALTAFLRELREGLRALEAPVEAAVDDEGAPRAAPMSPATSDAGGALRALEQTLDGLEELLEVFSLQRRTDSPGTRGGGDRSR